MFPRRVSDDLALGEMRWGCGIPNFIGTG